MSGSMAVGNAVVVPALQGDTSASTPSKVQSIQAFGASVTKASVGERVGVLLKGPDLSAMSERGFLTAPRETTEGERGMTTVCDRVLGYLDPIPSFTYDMYSGQTFSVTAGHDTVQGTLTLLGYESEGPVFTQSRQDVNTQVSTLKDTLTRHMAEGKTMPKGDRMLAVLQLKAPLLLPLPLGQYPLLGARLELPPQAGQCRLAFTLTPIETPADLHDLPYRRLCTSTLSGHVLRRDKDGGPGLVVSGLFSDNTAASTAISSAKGGLACTILTSDGTERGQAVVVSAFGTSGKVKCTLTQGDAQPRDTVTVAQTLQHRIRY
ncbi:hypothetical protein KIPB_004854, partial [Kipferlia bialata]|eukprot:g294.t1